MDFYLHTCILLKVKNNHGLEINYFIGLNPAVQWAHTLGFTNAKVVRVKNLTHVSQVDEIQVEINDPILKAHKETSS